MQVASCRHTRIFIILSCYVEACGTSLGVRCHISDMSFTRIKELSYSKK